MSTLSIGSVPSLDRYQGASARYLSLILGSRFIAPRQKARRTNEGSKKKVYGCLSENTKGGRYLLTKPNEEMWTVGIDLT